MLKNKIITLLLLLMVFGPAVVMGQTSAAPSLPFRPAQQQNASTDSVVVDVIDVNEHRWDHLTIISDLNLKKLLDTYREERSRKSIIDGYRVQIFTGKKDDAFKIKTRFIQQYPGYNVHIKFFTPDFYVRVGDFRTQSEAIRLKYKISADYPDPFIVEDQIGYPPLEANE